MSEAQWMEAIEHVVNDAFIKSEPGDTRKRTKAVYSLKQYIKKLWKRVVEQHPKYEGAVLAAQQRRQEQVERRRAKNGDEDEAATAASLPEDRIPNTPFKLTDAVTEVFMQLCDHLIRAIAISIQRHMSLRRVRTVNVGMVSVSVAELCQNGPLITEVIAYGMAALDKWQAFRSQPARVDAHGHSAPVHPGEEAGLTIPVPRIRTSLRSHWPAIRVSAPRNNSTKPRLPKIRSAFTLNTRAQIHLTACLEKMIALVMSEAAEVLLGTRVRKLSVQQLQTAAAHIVPCNILWRNSVFLACATDAIVVNEATTLLDGAMKLLHDHRRARSNQQRRSRAASSDSKRRAAASGSKKRAATPSDAMVAAAAMADEDGDHNDNDNDNDDDGDEEFESMDEEQDEEDEEAGGAGSDGDDDDDDIDDDADTEDAAEESQPVKNGAHQVPLRATADTTKRDAKRKRSDMEATTPKATLTKASKTAPPPPKRTKTTA